jgi:hypothetical protein
VLTLGKPVVEIASQPQISFIWQRDGGPTIQITPRFNQVGLAIESSHTEFLPILWFGPHIPDTAEDNARRYSDLSRKGESLPIAEAMRTEFPFLLELSTEFTSNGASIFATMAGRKEKVPVGLVSDGVNKLLGILIAIASIPNGTILLDQLEDGFYYDRLPSIWKLIHSFALTYAVQVFATTHSKESLEALRSLVEENPDDFCLLQAKRGEGSSTVNLIQGKFFGAALEQGTEIR